MSISTFFKNIFTSPPVSVRYDCCTDAELLSLAMDPDALTGAAREALFTELERRELEPPEPRSEMPEAEKSPLLKRDLSEVKKCGCGSKGCHK